MRADRHDENLKLLYDTLWSPFETEYWSTEQRRGRMKKPRLEWLIHSSLQAELHEEVDLARLYVGAPAVRDCWHSRRFSAESNS